MPASTRRRAWLAFAAWASLALGIYALVAVASVLGLFTGGFAGALGGLIALAVVTDRPDGRTRRVAKIALALNVLAVAVFSAVVVGFWIAN